MAKIIGHIVTSGPFRFGLVSGPIRAMSGNIRFGVRSGVRFHSDRCPDRFDSVSGPIRFGVRSNSVRCPARFGSVSGPIRFGVRSDSVRCPVLFGSVSGPIRFVSPLLRDLGSGSAGIAWSSHRLFQLLISRSCSLSFSHVRWTWSEHEKSVRSLRQNTYRQLVCVG